MRKSVFSVVFILVRAGCKPDSQLPSILPPPESVFDDESAVAFAYAAQQGNVETLQELLQLGVDANNRGEKDISPFAYSIDNLGTFRFLLEHGADPNVYIGGFNTVLHIAAGKKDIEFLRAALKYGADPDIRTRRLGETPLFAVSGSDASARIKLLVEAGADVDALSDGNETPLISNARAQRYDMVLALLQAGANFHVRTESGWSITKALDVSRDHYGQDNGHRRRLDAVLEFLVNACNSSATLICDEVREIDSEMRRTELSS